MCSCLASLTVGYRCDCVPSWSSRRPGVWSPAGPHTRAAMIGGRLAQQHSSAVGVVPWSPSRPVRVPCPGWRRMASTPPGPPACVACVGSSRMGPQAPRSRPLVATLGRDQWSRPGLVPPDYQLVMTRGRDPESRPARSLLRPARWGRVGDALALVPNRTREGRRGARVPPIAPSDLDAHVEISQ